MAEMDYIPTGRTSLVKRGDIALQVQTEYARRPNPRVTTCIATNGRVLHKVEKALDGPVASVEEQLRVELFIKRQHSEILSIIEQAAFDPKTGFIPQRPPTVRERLLHVPGAQHVFAVAADGSFGTDAEAREFEKRFGDVFRGLKDLLALFSTVPRQGTIRESGVCEVEPDRLYMASAGDTSYFVVVRRVDVHTDFEKQIKAALNEGV